MHHLSEPYCFVVCFFSIYILPKIQFITHILLFYISILWFSTCTFKGSSINPRYSASSRVVEYQQSASHDMTLRRTSCVAGTVTKEIKFKKAMKQTIKGNFPLHLPSITTTSNGKNSHETNWNYLMYNSYQPIILHRNTPPPPTPNRNPHYGPIWLLVYALYQITISAHLL